MKRDVTPGRCPYCGYRCDGETCAQHADLPALDSASVNSGDNSVEGGEK